MSRNSYDFDFKDAWKPCQKNSLNGSQCQGQSCSWYYLCTKEAKNPQPLNKQCASWYANCSWFCLNI